ncbi:hypothetical protein ACQR16_34440, partial [Bradyrhizobium oligotrophicum]
MSAIAAIKLSKKPSSHTFAISRRPAPELCAILTALFQTEGAGKAGRWPRPWPACGKKTQAAGTTGLAENARPSLRDGFTSRVEEGRGGLGDAATPRFPSPLIEPD